MRPNRACTCATADATLLASVTSRATRGVEHESPGRRALARAGSGTTEGVLSLRVHGIANAKLCLVSAAIVAAMVVALLDPGRAAEQSDSGPATSGPQPVWPTSPFHGVISGATGEPIPCRCRFQGTAYRLGDTVCMTTHLGVQFARCDLFLNNTSWIPTGVPCTMSRLDVPAEAGMHATIRSQLTR